MIINQLNNISNETQKNTAKKQQLKLQTSKKLNIRINMQCEIMDG